MEAFQNDLEALGFQFLQQARTGISQFSLRATPHLTYWVHADPGDKSVIFTWELAIGAFMDSRGLQIGSNEPLNQFAFPKADAKGPLDIAFVASEMDRAEQIIRGLNFLDET